jgi:chromosome segregation ATPase
MADEPENLVLQQLRVMRAEIAESHAQLRSGINSLRDELKGDMHSLRADVASDLLAMQAKNEAEHKATREQIAGLRRAVVEYHSAVLGHGMLISDLEARVRRLEQKVGISDA